MHFFTFNILHVGRIEPPSGPVWAHGLYVWPPRSWSCRGHRKWGLLDVATEDMAMDGVVGRVNRFLLCPFCPPAPQVFITLCMVRRQAARTPMWHHRAEVEQWAVNRAATRPQPPSCCSSTAISSTGSRRPWVNALLYPLSVCHRVLTLTGRSRTPKAVVSLTFKKVANVGKMRLKFGILKKKS